MSDSDDVVREITGPEDADSPTGASSSGSSDGRIDQTYYDSSDYFEGGAEHLLDADSPFQRYRIRKVLDIYLPARGERVLDMGCGWGTFCFELAPRVGEIVGVDFSERSIALCEDRLGREGFDNVRFVCADAGDTGLETGSFDTVIAADLVEHLYPDQTRAVMAEVHRLLKPGGHLALWTPHRGHFLEILKNNNVILKPDPTHVDYKSMDRLKVFVREAGLDVERAYYAESHLPLLSRIERMLLSRIPMLRRRIALLVRKRPG